MNIEEEARTYIGSEMTVKETASYCGVSKRTLQLHLRKLEELNPELHKLVLKKQQRQIILGQKKGGSIGRRKPNYTPENATDMAEFLIKNQATYKEASEITGIPSSTIYDMTHSKYIPRELQEKLSMVAEANHRQLSTTEYLRGIKK